MKRSIVLAIMTAILLLSALLRFYRLDNQSFWNDEGNSARLSERSIPLIIEGTASDIHPPLYYLLLKVWRTPVGDSEFGLRSFSAYLGVLLVAVTFSLGRRLLGSGSQWVSLTAAFMVAVDPVLVYYSQEARMYELLALLGIVSSLLLIRLLDNSRNRTVVALAYGICLAAGLYTHYFFPVVFLPQLFLVVVWHFSSSSPRAAQSKQALWFLAGSLAVAFIIYLPWMPIFLRQASGRQTGQVNIAAFFIDISRWLASGDFISQIEANWIMALLIILSAVGLILWNKLGSGRLITGLFILAAILSPLMMMWLLGTGDPVFYKFTLMVYPWWALAVSMGLVLLIQVKKGRFSLPLNLLIVIGAAGLFLWGSSRALWNMYDNPDFARADYRAIAEQIRNENYPNSAVVLNAANQWEVFTYYHDDEMIELTPVLPLPRGNPDADQIDEQLSELASMNSRIYTLFWGEAERDPERLVEKWLDSHAFKAREVWVGDVRLATYAVQNDSNYTESRDLDILFGRVMRLESATTPTQEVRPGDIIPVTLYWSAERALEKRYKIFLHLVDNEGQLVAQRDSEPGGGLALTTTWIVGERFEDKHGLYLPEEIKPGSYELILGIYPLGDPNNRLTYVAAGSDFDVFPLTTIIVPP